MKTIIAGCRDFHDYDIMLNGIQESNFTISEVVSGAAKGVDSLGEQYAQEYNLSVSVFPANWNKHGNAAGPIRNKQMAEYADQLIAVWDGKSKGTKNMIDQMNKQNKPVYIVKIDR